MRADISDIMPMSAIKQEETFLTEEEAFFGGYQRRPLEYRGRGGRGAGRGKASFVGRFERPESRTVRSGARGGYTWELFSVK